MFTASTQANRERMAAEPSLLDDVDLTNLPSSLVNQAVNRGYQSSSDDFVEIINADLDDFVSGDDAAVRRISAGSDTDLAKKITRQTSKEEKPKSLSVKRNFSKVIVVK